MTASQGTLSDTRRRRAEAASPVQIGEIVADKYRVERIIAAGGMGVVVSARHLVLNQTVAIKFLIPQAMEEQTIARFLREAKAAARIQSERVVRVYDCGTLPDGVPYMVMEHLEGIDLAQHIRQHGPLDPDEAVDLVVSTLEGVAEAHALHIVHRDLKPANVFLVGKTVRPYSVKVLDFGISKIQPGPDSPIDDELTGTAMMLGSPRYIAPEQARNSSHVDARADVWSVGVILYELLDGKCPFAGDTIGEVLSKVLLHEPPPLDTKRGDMPRGLDKVIAKCIERDREQRYANVAELARALAPFGSELARFHVQRIERIFDLPHVPVESVTAAATPAGDAPPREPGLDAPRPDGPSASFADAPAAGYEPAAGAATDGAWEAGPTPAGRGFRRLALYAGAAVLGLAAVGGWVALRGNGALGPEPSPPGASALASSALVPAPSADAGAPPALPDATGTGSDAAATASATASAPLARPGGAATARATATEAPDAPRTSTARPPSTGKGVLDRSD